MGVLNEKRCKRDKAINEFLSEHRDWQIKEQLPNNNGLTILEKI